MFAARASCAMSGQPDNGPNGVAANYFRRGDFRRARVDWSRSSRRSYHQTQTVVRVSRSSLSRICWTCFCTVRPLHPRICPISSLRLPAAIHSTTSSSRFVRGRDPAEAIRFDDGLFELPLSRPFRAGMGGLRLNTVNAVSRPYAQTRMKPGTTVNPRRPARVSRSVSWRLSASSRARLFLPLRVSRRSRGS